MRTMQDLTQEEINALPDNHPWKHVGKFSFGGMDFEANDEIVAEHEAREREQRIKVKTERLESHYVSDSGVPARYHLESLDTYQCYTPELMRIMKTVTSFAENPANKTLILCGGNGVGKTHLACGVIRKCGGLYRTVQRLMFEADGTMSFKATETKVQLLDRMGTAPMLVLDEIGRGAQVERQQELVQYVLDLRYCELKPTVLVSNLSKADLIKWLGQSI